jgi:hypothetical protein
VRLDHLLSKELTNYWLPVSVTSVGRRVAHGWNINELNTGKTDAAHVVFGGIGCGCMVFMLS